MKILLLVLVLQIPYVYPVRKYEVIDGDSIKTDIDLGFNLTFSASARVHGIDAPEMSKEERQAGIVVKQVVVDWCEVNEPLIVQSVAKDKYEGRYVAKVFGKDGTSLSDYLLKRKLVLPYDGKKKVEWTCEELQRIEETKP